jgi:hypothetical protein
MKPKIPTSEVSEGKVTTQDVLKNDSCYILVLPLYVLKLEEFVLSVPFSPVLSI